VGGGKQTQCAIARRPKEEEEAGRVVEGSVRRNEVNGVRVNASMVCMRQWCMRKCVYASSSVLFRGGEERERARASVRAQARESERARGALIGSSRQFAGTSNRASLGIKEGVLGKEKVFSRA
jgi:hypothetical protein